MKTNHISKNCTLALRWLFKTIKARTEALPVLVHRMKTLRPLHCLLLLLALPAVVPAQFLYEINSGAIIITKYTGSGGAVAIPSTMTGLPVMRIGSHAFSASYNLTSVTIPDSVTDIGWEAFSSCTHGKWCARNSRNHRPTVRGVGSRVSPQKRCTSGSPSRYRRWRTRRPPLMTNASSSKIIDGMPKSVRGTCALR